MKRMITAITLAVAVLGAAASAFALGTSAGTVIQNRATATYDIGAATNLTAYSSTVSTTVDELINVLVDDAGAGTTFVVSLPARSATGRQKIFASSAETFRTATRFRQWSRITIAPSTTLLPPVSGCGR